MGDEVYLYYGGYARGHKVNRFEERQIGLVKMKQDRYVARTISGGTGELVTPLLRFHAETLLVNANAEGGMLRVEIRNDAGTPLQGFTFADCSPITADTIASPVTWAHPLNTVKDIRLAFQLEQASLFAFYLE
ncbi:MAG: hypothetical protein BWY09_02483 [Candidatus Hydrogenedentes bacterium ADurb.Bin179]|nr:MAG: hypothetical protein BWY09_02483 [Candidatus Hydrogenedentes bacterium ADurb.Bin179]